jgi:hypothetical protein
VTTAKDFGKWSILSINYGKLAKTPMENSQVKKRALKNQLPCNINKS